MAKKGVKFTEEHKKNISEAMKEVWKSEEHREKIHNIKAGKKLSEEHKSKISESIKELAQSDEYIQKLSDAKKGNSNACKYVKGIHTKTGEVIYFKSQLEAGKYIGRNSDAICTCCNYWKNPEEYERTHKTKPRKTVGKYTWHFVSKEEYEEHINNTCSTMNTIN